MTNKEIKHVTEVNMKLDARILHTSTLLEIYPVDINLGNFGPLVTVCRYLPMHIQSKSVSVDIIGKTIEFIVNCSNTRIELFIESIAEQELTEFSIRTSLIRGDFETYEIYFISRREFSTCKLVSAKQFSGETIDIEKDCAPLNYKLVFKFESWKNLMDWDSEGKSSKEINFVR